MPATHPLAGLLASAAAAVIFTAASYEVGAQDGAPAVIASPDDPGPNEPPLGRSLFDELFEVGSAEQRHDARYDIPFPFDALLADLQSRASSRNVRTALIPLGRSLQRFSADPDYFASPRIVVAVDGEATGEGEADRPLLKDRLFLGFQPASQSIEVLSYNEQAGRFEFQEVLGYAAGQTPEVEYSERTVCTTCHQAHAPIFATALWSETNGSRPVADALADLGESFHGVPVRQGVDGPDFFDQSTDRANFLPVAAAIWKDGCGAAGDPAACRAELLSAALAYRLGGSRVKPKDPATVTDALIAQWPDGIWAPNHDLPNRDPMIPVAAGAEPVDVIEASGQFDPTVSREAVPLWLHGDSAAALFSQIFAQADVAWLDRRLGEYEAGTSVTASATCTVTRSAGSEIRFECRGPKGGFAAAGHAKLDGETVTGGRVDRLQLSGHAPLQRLQIAGGRLKGQTTVVLELREAAAGMHARLATGERLSALTIDFPSGGGAAEIAIIDDQTALAQAIAALPTLSVDQAPLRRTILAELDADLPLTKASLQ